MNNFELTRPSDDRSQDFQSNPISSGSERQRAVDPSFVNTNELGYDSLNRDKSSLETSAHNILPGHDHSKPLVNEQDSFVNIPGSFPGDQFSTENQGLTGNHHTTDQVQHKSNHGAQQALYSAKETIGADIGSNNQYAKNIDESGLYDHTSSALGRVNPEVSATLKDTRNTIGADYGNNQFQGDSGRQFDTGLHDRNSTGLGSTPAHAASGIREGNHDMSQLIHDIHRTSLDDKSTQNTDHHQGVSGLRADDDISTRSVHNAPMVTASSTSGSSEQFGNQQDSLNARSTPSGFGRESSHGLGGQTGHHTGLDSGIESQINEYKRDISGPTEHTDVRSGLGESRVPGAASGLDSSSAYDQHRPSQAPLAFGSGTSREVVDGAPVLPSYNEQSIPHSNNLGNPTERANFSTGSHEAAKPHYGELTTKEVLTDSFGNPPHNTILGDIKLAESNDISNITGNNQRNTGNTDSRQEGNELTTEELLTDSFGNPPQNPILKDTKLSESNEITNISGSVRPNNRDIGNTLGHKSEASFDPTNPQAEHLRDVPGVMNVAHSHDDLFAPSLQSSTVDNSAKQGSLSTLPEGASNAETTNHLNRDLHSSTNPFTKDITGSSLGSGSTLEAEHGHSSGLQTTTNPFSKGDADSSLGNNITNDTTNPFSTSHRVTEVDNDSSNRSDLNTAGTKENIPSRPTGSTALDNSNPTVLNTKRDSDDGIPTFISTDSSHDNGLSDATNNTSIHRDDSNETETGTASALGSMIMGKIKQVAGSILGNEQMKTEGETTHVEAKQELHEAKNMNSNE